MQAGFAHQLDFVLLSAASLWSLNTNTQHTHTLSYYSSANNSAAARKRLLALRTGLYRVVPE